MPGTSGTLSPYSKIEGLYFDNSNEPDDFLYRIQNDLSEYYDNKSNTTFIKLDFDNEYDFFDCLSKLQEYSRNNITVYGTSREGELDIVYDDKELENIGEPDSSN